MTPHEFKLLREATGFSQEDLASFLCVAVRRVENWEQGIHPVPAWALKLLAAREPLLLLRKIVRAWVSRSEPSKEIKDRAKRYLLKGTK